MTCSIRCGRKYCDRYDHNLDAIALATSLINHKILTSSIIENGSRAFLALTLDDGRIINVGVSGNLHDEAYLFFGADRMVQVDDLAKKGDVILAIKLYREQTGARLLDAKRYVDKVRREAGLI